jgi:hypothetical protein
MSGYNIMNETSAVAATTLELSPLKALQDILHNRIIQKKGEMHESHNRAYTDNLWRDRNTTLDVDLSKCVFYYLN